MTLLPSEIVMIQHFPSTGNYLVYKGARVPEYYAGMQDIEDDVVLRYIRECRANGSFYESTVKLPTGKVTSNAYVKVKQVIYCKALDAKPKKSKTPSVSSADTNESLQTNIHWVTWSPVLYNLAVNSGRIPFTRHYRIQNLSEAPEDVMEFVRNCLDDGHFVLSRTYTRPVTECGLTRITYVTEYFFSMGKIIRDFQGSNVTCVSREDFSFGGLPKAES